MHGRDVLDAHVVHQDIEAAVVALHPMYHLPDQELDVHKEYNCTSIDGSLIRPLPSVMHSGLPYLSRPPTKCVVL